MASLASPSVPVRRIEAVELAQQRGPLQQAEPAAHAGLEEVVGLLDDRTLGQRLLGSARERHDLQLAGTLQPEDVVERLRDAGTRSQQAVVAQDHHLAL